MSPTLFFGASMQAATEEDRKRKRSANRDLAMAKLKEGNVNAASELFQRALNVTPIMAHQLIQVLRSENIEFVVAPYEADAQLAYMSKIKRENGGVVAVITEDSDLIAYGCPAIVFKMDRYGNGESIELDKVFKAEACKPSFRNFDMELFTGMSVLAGCDFLPSVPGIGIVRAHALVSKYRNLDRVLSVLKMEKGNQVPGDYAKSFKEAIAVFRHARIYDPNAKELKHLAPLPQNLLQSFDGNLDFLGPEIPRATVTAIAEGNLNPSTKKVFDKLESSALPVDPIVLKSNRQYRRVEVFATPAHERSLKVFDSLNARENNTVTSSNLVVNKDKYSGEALPLQKLIRPLVTCGSAEKENIPDKTPLRVPDNNPFRIKPEEICLFQRENPDEQVLVTRSAEYMDVCMNPDSFPEETSENLSRKRNFETICSDEAETCDDQISEVTVVEAEDPDMLCWNVISQESVDSKTVKCADLKRRGASEKKFKKSVGKKAGGKNSSILNFFSRV
ncbi:exonuclease 1 isoform X2 [Neltuma alba]|uniref:exonuclease 1 isoform X2 n=1 Tax=Neltuma alba TaxID=207710 RepID=UPI0010A3ACF4|nr:exonuclease 1 isoform X2 [Prosopis alba]